MNGFSKLIIWLGLMAAFAILLMGGWLIVVGDAQTTAELKWLQFLQTFAIFLFPAILGAWIWSEDHRPFRWLRMDRKADWQTFVIAVGIMICAVPAINLLADLNGRIKLPESLASIEEKMRAMEDKAAALTELLLKADNFGGVVFNLFLLALLPALSEEVSFRGTLQQILSNSPMRYKSQTHVAIWVTAIVFSAIHMQFYGFIPRMLMGAMFGYVFVWTGSLWVPIVMHFTNNGLAVLSYYFLDGIGVNGKNYADTIGAGTTWWLGVISLLITSLGLLIFYRRTHTR